MKDFIIKKFIILVILFPTIILAETHIPAGSVSGNWNLAGSPYLIEGEIEVPDGETLTIDPGCLIEFQGYYKFNVQGRILAIGTEQDSIRFTIADTTGFSNFNSTAGGWHGIRFENTPTTNDSSKIVYCILEYGKAIGNEYAENHGGAIYVNNFNKLIIKNSFFNECMANDPNAFSPAGGAIAIKDNSYVKVLNCKFTNCISFNGGAVSVEDNSIAEIINCEFLNNDAMNGGGLYMSHCTSIVEDCYFIENTANNAFGGGLYSFFSESMISNCIFWNNCSEDSNYTAQGGGLFISCFVYYSVIQNCIFSNNLSNNGGGASFSGDVDVMNCLFVNNTSITKGGGIYCYQHNGKFVNCTIAKNEALFGGGVYCATSTTFINTIIYDNYIHDIYLLSSNVDPYFIKCDIEDGIAGFSGSGSTSYDETRYQNCIEEYPKFLDPTMSYGQNFNGLEADFSLRPASMCINNGLQDTTALNLPEFDLNGNDRIFLDVIDMGAYENNQYFTNFKVVPKTGYIPLTVEFEDISNGYQTWWEWDFENDGNIDSYEQNPVYTYELHDNYSVSLTSGNSQSSDTETKFNYINVQYLLDAEFGSNTNNGIVLQEISFTDSSVGYIQTWEWDFENDGIIDSYEQNPVWEYTEPGIYDVSLTVFDGTDYDTELKNDYIVIEFLNTISGNILENTILNADTINVVGEVTVMDGVTLTISPGVTMLFHDHYKLNVQGRLLAVGTEQDSIKFTVADTTGFSNFNSTAGGWHGIRFENTPATNDSSKIVYCILEYGKAIGIDLDGVGGAVYAGNSSKMLIHNSIFRSNFAHSRGGAIYSGHQTIITENTVINNHAGSGGGIYTRGSEIFNNTITENSASYGGGIYVSEESIVNNNIISDNMAYLYGGAIFLDTSTWHESNSCIIGNLISSNEANFHGGGLCGGGNNQIINCTISANISEQGAGYFCEDSNYSNMINCVVFDNVASEDSTQIYLYGYWYHDYDPGTHTPIHEWRPANINIYYTDLEGGYDNIFMNFEGSTTQYPITYNFDYENNIDSDPLFLDPDNNDYHFFADSPCINAGTPDTTGLNLPDYDLDGNSRIYDGIIDMGCYEWQGTPINSDELPITNYELSNYPNPFNPSTTIEFNLPQNFETAKIEIYNIKGQKVKTFTNQQITQSPNQQIIWDGTDQTNKSVSSGIYFYQLKVDGKVEKSKKMMLIK